jgi:rhodanese-related sulfurtransferase
MKHGAKLIDVRSTKEYRALHAKDSISVPPEVIKEDRVGLERDTEILVICMSGRRSLRQARKLTELGYTNVTNLAGGLNYWTKFGLPVKRTRTR